MSARTANRFRPVWTAVLFVVAAVAVSSRADPPESAKKSDSKTPAPLPLIKLPDGTYLYSSNDPGGVTLPLQDYQKLQDQLEQQKKQIAALQASAPSRCDIRGRVEKQGEQLVAVLKLTYSFHTVLPQTAVNLGARKGFPQSASLDGGPMPVLKPGDDGFTALIERAGDHTLVLDLQASVTSRGPGPKTELGFELGLPRAAITTLAFDPPRPDVKVMTLTTRTPDPAAAGRPAEPRKTSVDVKQLAKHDGREGYPLGPVESLEASWEPPAAAVQPVDQVQTAELDPITVLFTEAAVETTAKIRLRGPAREWRIVAPLAAEMSLDRVGPGAETAPAPQGAIAKPKDAAKPVWKIDLPTGTTAADWMVTIVMRQPRSRPDDPRHRGPFPIGPFTVLDVQRQTGSVRLTAGPNTRFAFKHGPDLRQTVPGPTDDDVSVATFRLTTGPTGSSAPNQPQPLLSVEASTFVGSVSVKPTYKFSYEKSESVWKVQVDLQVFPVHTTVDSLAIEIPAEWGVVNSSIPAPLVPEPLGVDARLEGFWAVLGAKVTRGGRRLTVLKLPEGKKKPFDLTLTTFVRVPPGAGEIQMPLLRFPDAVEADVAVTATVPDGLEIRQGEGFAGDGAAAHGFSLKAEAGKGNKDFKLPPSAGISRVLLRWSPVVADLHARIIASATLTDRQLEITESITLTSVDGLPKTIHFRARENGPEIAGLRGKVSAPAGGQFQRDLAKEWVLNLENVKPGDAKAATLEISYAVPFDHRRVNPDQQRLPVPLLAPVGASQSEATVRVWCHTSVATAVANLSGGWRELPSDPGEHDAIPSITLFGAADAPLVLEARAVRDSVSTVWVDRALIKAWTSDDGVTRYSAQFLISRWLTPNLEMRLPGSVSGGAPEFFRAQKPLKAMPESIAGETVYRIPLDDWTGRNVVVEVRYQLPPARDDELQPPILANASYSGPVRWQAIVPAGAAPLLTAGAAPELHWRWRLGGYIPIPARSSKDLESWFKGGDEQSSGDEAGPAGEAVVARQLAPAPLTLHRAPRYGLVLIGSVFVFFLTLVLTRLPVRLVGPIVAVLGLVAGICAVIWPHATAQSAGFCQPGLAAALGLLLILAAMRAYHHRRVTHLPGFARTFLEPSAGPTPVAASSRSRPSSTGSAGAAPVAAGG